MHRYDPPSYSGPTLVYLSRNSRNRKTGRIPVTVTTSNTCPPTCPWRGSGCYAETGFTLIHWRRMHKAGVRGVGVHDWESFCNAVRDFPPGQVWRHNEGGDLPGEGNHLDTQALLDLVVANAGRRGFTYTHKPLQDGSERHAVHEANAHGFTINRSADSMEQADRHAAEGFPVVLVLPHNTVWRCSMRTPQGRRLVMCPAVVHEGKVTCVSCALCAKPMRKSIIVFPTHGREKLHMTEALTQLRLPGVLV